MSRSYLLQLGPLQRELPLQTLPNGITIASFVLLGDAELTTYAAAELAKRLAAFPEAMLVTLESKGIPLAQALAARRLQPRFVVLRKTVKDYMQDPLTTTVHAITTQAPQQLVLAGEDAARLAGKTVILVDDVISSGQSLQAAQALLAQVDAHVVAQAAVLAEGAAALRQDVICLAPLPLFKSDQ
ncbi:phosphoribosyltransferase family protein [Lacticaseibacillus baoqingensis]|uniref:Phosphoribosyltransferase family protein n=1 Tax=Lacticaseibacillus baoqingensis TaxID=2486013 RepID=A0ABW4E4U0_9LACO|nr:phosphoribosyltransferase family protein [Lacticaseibacillus baoqingensis]